MLAAFGWPAAEVTNFGNLLTGDGRAPSLLNGGLENINIGYWAAVIALAAGAEASSRNVRYIAGKNPKLAKELVPGDLGVDPFNADSPANREVHAHNRSKQGHGSASGDNHRVLLSVRHDLIHSC